MNLIDEFGLKNIITQIGNISLDNLLINCGVEEIQGLIYYFSIMLKKDGNLHNNNDKMKDYIDQKQLGEKILDKIYKILPQDIILILPEKNIIKMKYFESKDIYNFKDYINVEENKKYKISIIYTFTSISSIVDGQNNQMSFMISEIKSENALKILIDEVKYKNENDKFQKEKFICLHFDQSNLNKIKFISDYILYNFKNDNYYYIFIIHINRNFDKKINDKIYSLPDINPEINQLFIDNLNCENKIILRDLFTDNINIILEEYKEELRLDDEFNKTLYKFLKKELNEKGLKINDYDGYIEDIKTYINEEKSIKEKIIEMIYKYIDIKGEHNCKDIIENIYSNKMVNKYIVDISTSLIEYIKEEIFNKYLKIIFEFLEDNNIITTFFEIKKGNYQFLNKNHVIEIITAYLDQININDCHIYKSKFAFNYYIPGFYNFFEDISNYINNYIYSNYFNNEKNLRKFQNKIIGQINKFDVIEEKLSNKALEEVCNNHQFILNMIDYIPDELVLNDYLTYFLQKYKNKKDIYNVDDIYHNIIKLFIKIRFTQENKILQNYDEIGILLLKIIFIESNANNILNILKIIENSKIIFENNEQKFYIKIREIIFSHSGLKYINNEKKNFAYNKEINECYNLLLASICYCITSNEIQIIKNNDNKITNYNETQIGINNYYHILRKIYKLLKIIDNEQNIHLNEIFMIDELITIIEIFKKYNNIKNINKIKYHLRENAFIIRKHSNDNGMLESTDELIYNFETIYYLITNNEGLKKDQNYYVKLSQLFFKEIKKSSDNKYKYDILKIILEEKKIIKISNEIFQLLLQDYLKGNHFVIDINNLLYENNIIIKKIEENLNINYNLKEVILDIFEKNSLIYYNKIINNQKDNTNIEDISIEILKYCIIFLDYYINISKLINLETNEISKLFCFAYIKTFFLKFIIIVKDNNIKWKEPKKIIIDENAPLYEINHSSIYKILYNNNTLHCFYQEKNIAKNNLKNYKKYIDFIQVENLNNNLISDVQKKIIIYKEASEVNDKDNNLYILI